MSSIALNPVSLVLLFVAGMFFGIYTFWKLFGVAIRLSPDTAMQSYSKLLGLGAWIRFSRNWAVIECPKCGHGDVILPGEIKDPDGKGGHS